LKLTTDRINHAIMIMIMMHMLSALHHRHAKDVRVRTRPDGQQETVTFCTPYAANGSFHPAFDEGKSVMIENFCKV
jgi:hypothetical protein